MGMNLFFITSTYLSEEVDLVFQKNNIGDGKKEKILRGLGRK